MLDPDLLEIVELRGKVIQAIGRRASPSKKYPDLDVAELKNLNANLEAAKETFRNIIKEQESRRK